MRKSSFLFFAIAIGTIAAIQFVFDVFPHVFMAPISFVATWLLSVCILLVSFGPSGLAGAYRAAVRGGDKAEIQQALAFFASAKRLLTATPVICIILAAIDFLRDLTTLNRLGESLAIALCSILYSALGIVFAVEPFRAAAEKRLAELG
jgi:hypothetical protein